MVRPLWIYILASPSLGQRGELREMLGVRTGDLHVMPQGPASIASSRARCQVRYVTLPEELATADGRDSG